MGNAVVLTSTAMSDQWTDPLKVQGAMDECMYLAPPSGGSSPFSLSPFL